MEGGGGVAAGERAGQQLVDILPGDQSLKLTGRRGRGIGGDAGGKREETGAPAFLFLSVGPLSVNVSLPLRSASPRNFQWH